MLLHQQASSKQLHVPLHEFACKLSAESVKAVAWGVAVNGGRINIGACSVGGASMCLDFARDYVAGRSQFGRPLASFQATKFKLADMATQIHASRLMVRWAW